MNITIPGVLALAGVVCVLAGIAALLGLFTAPAVGLIIFGFVLLIAAAFLNGRSL